MCNLYSITTKVEAIRRLFAVDRMDSSVGNLPAQPSIFPAYDAPVIGAVWGFSAGPDIARKIQNWRLK
jgi:hypothetical protein